MDKKKFAEGTPAVSKMMTMMNSNQKEANPLIITNNRKLSMLMMSYRNIIPQTIQNLKIWGIGLGNSMTNTTAKIRESRIIKSEAIIHAILAKSWSTDTSSSKN